jgi:hypothetical protein
VAGDTKNDLLWGSRAGAGIVADVLSGAHSREELESAPHAHVVDTVGDFAAFAIATRTGELARLAFRNRFAERPSWTVTPASAGSKARSVGKTTRLAASPAG